MRLLAILTLLVPSLAHAQDDTSAGLFAEARQIPIISQSIAITLRPTDADVSLRQTFLNEGAAVAQADYHVYLPEGASLLGFGFWQKDRFLEAKLAAKEEAQARHTRAATEGRTTGIVKSERNIHSLSVYPLEGHTTKRVATRFSVPVVRELGRSHLRVPIDRFVGQAAPSTTVVVHIEADGRIEDIGVDGAEHSMIDRSERGARFVFTTRQPVDIWWREAGPPISAVAQAVRIAEHETYAVDVRFQFNDGRAADPAPVTVFVDGSASMRRRAGSASDLVRRLQKHTDVEVRLFAETVQSIDARAITDLIKRGAVGHAASSTTLMANRAACKQRRCILVTDPNFEGLEDAARAEMSIVVLGDAHELAFRRDKVPNDARTYAIDAPSAPALHALADGLVLPSLSIVSLRQGGTSLEIASGTDRKVVQGGVLRFVATSGRTSKITVEGLVGNRKISKQIAVEELEGGTDAAQRVRLAYFRGYLEKEMKRFRSAPSSKLRQKIIAASVREGVPTELTALQVDDPTPTPRPDVYARRPTRRRDYSLFGGSSTPEPAEWAAFLVLLALAGWAARRSGRGSTA